MKPFSLGELQARLRALSRRGSGPQPDVIEAGELQLDVDGREVRVGDDLVELTGTEFALLEYLMRNQGAVLSRDQLRARGVGRWLRALVKRGGYLHPLRAPQAQGCRAPTRPDPHCSRPRVCISQAGIDVLPRRFRLTAWFVVVMAAFVTVLGGVVYYVVQDQLRKQVDDGVRATAFRAGRDVLNDYLNSGDRPRSTPPKTPTSGSSPTGACTS